MTFRDKLTQISILKQSGTESQHAKHSKHLSFAITSLQDSAFCVSAVKINGLWIHENHKQNLEPEKSYFSHFI